MFNAIVQFVTENFILIISAGFGGLVLFGIHLTEHFQRETQDKLCWIEYSVFFVALLFMLPILGVGVTSIYLFNGDKISPLLAFQVGLTSPAIVKMIITASANHMGSKPVKVEEGQ